MEQEDRKKKLAAGKEKLAAFRKKRAKKKKTDSDDSQVQDSTGTDVSGQEIPCVDGVNITSPCDTTESDQYSFTSGDEWSAEESDMQAAVVYQTKLAAATQKIAELEEAVEGKQMALDRMVFEMQMTESSPKVSEMLEERDMQTPLKGSVPELQEALMQRDKIIRQLTTHLQETAVARPYGVEDPLDYAQETQRLSQQVMVLQRQLSEAGETVQQQVAMCQMSVQALQGAREQILSLQGKVTEKNNHIHQLSNTLATTTSEVTALRQKENQLEQLLQTLHQQTSEAGSDSVEISQSAADRVTALEQELDKLSAEHTQSLQSAMQLQQRLSQSETAYQALCGDKAQALEKIGCLEEELAQLATLKDEALKKMSDLEQQVQEGSLLHQANEHLAEAKERITQLEGEIMELNNAHTIQLNQLNEKQEHSLAESLRSSQTDMEDLKNIINSQQGELLSLHEHLKLKEDELSANKEHMEALQGQLKDLENKDRNQETETVVAVSNYQQQMQELRDENIQYKQQMALVQEQVSSFMEFVKTSSQTYAYNALEYEGDSPDVPNLDNAESDIATQIQCLQISYSNLFTHYSQTLEKGHNVHGLDVEKYERDKTGNVDGMTAELAQLRGEIVKWTEEVQKKDSEIVTLKREVQCLVEEKQSLALQIEQHEQATQKQTLQSDTLQRRMESRVSSLFSEVTEFKEALKESEVANMELQDKVEILSKETDSLRLQLTVSEDMMKDLKSQSNTAGIQLAQTQAELQLALQNTDSSVRQLQEELKEKDSCVSQLKEELREKDSSVSQLQGELREKDSSVLQLQGELREKDSSVSQLQEELKEKDSCVSQLQEELREKDSSVSQLQEDLKEKDSSVSQLQEELKDKDSSVSQLQDRQAREFAELNSKLEEKTVQLEVMKSENEKLLSNMNSLQTDRDTLSVNNTVLEEQIKQAEVVSAEREQLLSSVKAETNQQLKEMLQKFDQSHEQCQMLLCEKEELLSNQLVSSEKRTDLLSQLQDKEHAVDILVAENEQMHNELLSHSSAFNKEKKALTQELMHQRQKFDILLSDMDDLQNNFFSKESECSWQLQKAQDNLKNSGKEIEALKLELMNMASTSSSKDDTIESLSSKVDELKEKLLAETASAKMLQDKVQTAENLQAHSSDVEQELARVREENEAVTAQLASQANMFRLKKEEMVRENNALNHQLEGVKNDAHETVHQLQTQLDGLHEQVKNTSATVVTQEEEIAQLKEEVKKNGGSLQSQENQIHDLEAERSSQKDNLDSLQVSNAALNKEKEQLLVRIEHLESSVEEIQRLSNDGVTALQSEIDKLQEEKTLQVADFEKEKLQLLEQNSSLQEQLDSCLSEIDRLQKTLKDATAEQDTLKLEASKLQLQYDSLQLDFTSQMEQAQSELADKDTELQSISTQLRDSKAELVHQLETLQEDLALTQSENVQKESSLISAKEELAATTLQLKRLTEEKDLLKSNFDCCMDDMAQRASEKDTTIQQLQGRLSEASEIVDRDHGQLREMYESQLTELEDRLAAADLETQRLEKMCENSNTEKEKLKESHKGHIAELELTVQSAELELANLKEKMTEINSKHERDIDDLKHSFEIQLSSVEDNCQSLEKALAKQDTALLDSNSKHEKERLEREKVFDHQLCEAYEQARLYEMDINRLKRQLDEMRKDHQKELQEAQKVLETQIFDLENKCVIATSELERLRQSLWGKEHDHTGEIQSYNSKIQELGTLTHSQEKQIAELQDKLAHSSMLSDDSIVSLKETYQADISHLQEINKQLRQQAEESQGHIKTMQSTHAQEVKALKHEHSQNVNIVEEKCRKAENYSQVLQLHMDSVSPSPKSPECDILRADIERLQQELAAVLSSNAYLMQRLKENNTLTENLEDKERQLQESQTICHNLEQKNHQLAAENESLRKQSSQDFDAENVEGRFVSLEEDGNISEQMKQNLDQAPDAQTAIKSASYNSGLRVKKSVSFASEGGFEPEPDSLGYLDLAVEPKPSGDYFVEESESSKSPKLRSQSVPSGTDFDASNENSIMASRILLHRSPDRDTDSPFEDGQEVAGRFEPEEENVVSSQSGRRFSGNTLKPKSAVDGFQPESLPASPDRQFPAGAPNLSFLPHPVTVLPDMQGRAQSVQRADSSSQTEDSLLMESSEGTSKMQSKYPSGCQTTEEIKDEQETVGDKSTSGDKSEEEAAFARRLKGLHDQLEEQWTQKMRSQEVELRHSNKVKFEEFKRQTEHQCQLLIKQEKQTTQASFVDAVRKMRKSLEKQYKRTEKATGVEKRKKLSDRSSKRDPGVQQDSEDHSLDDIVKQLHEENQELAEVRDVLLEQIAISQTQGLRQTMQHELQTRAAGGSKLSPHSTVASSSYSQSVQENLEDTAASIVPEELCGVMQSQGVYSCPNLDSDDGDGSFQADSLDELDTTSTPAAGSDGDDDRSEGSCVRERFLEELEEISQQSGLDLPLEWELTSTAVSHSSSGEGAGVFERDQAGSGSVWEVFDGRCLRHDCREVRHRYNNLFHWLSRVCGVPSTSVLLGEGNSQDNGKHEASHQEGQGEGTDVGEAEKLDSVNVSQLFDGKEAAVEALLKIVYFSSELELGDRENASMSETELLSRLLVAETKKINLEQRMNNHQKLFTQERNELLHREEELQAKCDDLESNNTLLLQQIADLKPQLKLAKNDQKGLPEYKTDNSCREADGKACLAEDNAHFDKIKEHHLEGELDSHSDTKSVLLEKDLLVKQLSDAHASLIDQQKEILEERDRKDVLEEQCIVLRAEVKTAETEIKSLQASLLQQQVIKAELNEKCGLLTQKVESMSDYQGTVQKSDKLQKMCNSLEKQLAVSMRDVSRLQSENQTLLQENQAMNASCKELKDTAQFLYAREKNDQAQEEKCQSLQERRTSPVQGTDRSTHVHFSASHKPGSSVAELPKDNGNATQTDLKSLHEQIELWQDENRSLRDKVDVLIRDNRSLKTRYEAIQDRNKYLRDQSEAHNSRNAILQSNIQYLKENVKAADEMNNALVFQVQKYKDIEKQCHELEMANKSMSEEVADLKKSDRSLQVLEEKCQALQDELLEATQSSQSLREQLHEQSMTLEHVISEMKEENSQCQLETPEISSGITSIRRNELKDDVSLQAESPSLKEEQDLRRQLSDLNKIISRKDEFIAELKEQMTVLSLQQAAVGSPPAQRESVEDMEQEIQELREEVVEKDGIIQELQEQQKSLKQCQVDLKRRVKEDSDLEQEVSILHQALMEKEKIIQEMKETSKLLQLSHQEKSQSTPGSCTGSKTSFTSSKRQERITDEDLSNRLQISQNQMKKVATGSSRSLESTESIAISSDPDSDVIPGQDMDLMKEMGKLRKDIKKTKAVYANESALFQEALYREPLSQLGLRRSQSPIDVSEMTPNDIPDDPEQLKKLVVKLLEENKCLTTENLRLQLRIREQEALVVEMEGRLQSIQHPPEDWHPLFERQLLLLQKQRDELQHLICERDTGGLLSPRTEKEGIEAVALQQKQEDLTVKIGELEHCHQLLQQRQAELAHCQAEKRHLEQILLLKDETERQLMRQKRLLEEELSSIEGKLQEREATLIEEKARLMKELKEKELHIFHLQSSRFSQQPQYSSNQQSVQMGRPQSASTPRVSNKFQSSQAFFLQPFNSQAHELSALHQQEGVVRGGSFLEEPSEQGCSATGLPEDSKTKAVSQPAGSGHIKRRHSIGASGHVRPIVSLQDPDEVYKFHQEAVNRLREKLRLQMEEEMAQLSEGQTTTTSGNWDQQKQDPQ